MFVTKLDFPDPLRRVFKCLPDLNALIPLVERRLKTPDAFPPSLPRAIQFPSSNDPKKIWVDSNMRGAYSSTLFCV